MTESKMAAVTNYVISIMQQVERSHWNPFKLSEIASLETCLHEIAADDPRFRSLLRKLANDCVFVEPARKIAYMSRTEDQEKSDNALRVKVNLLEAQISELDAEIAQMEDQSAQLIGDLNDKKEARAQLEKSVSALESAYESSTTEFNQALEQAFYSLETSRNVIFEKIPSFVDTIGDSPFLKHVGSLPGCYKELLIELIKKDRNDSNNGMVNGGSVTSAPKSQCLSQTSDTQLSLTYKRASLDQLKVYLKHLSALYKSLKLIDEAFTKGIPEEIEYIKALNGSIECLQKPPAMVPRKFTRARLDLRPMDQPELSVGPPNKIEDMV